MGLLVVLVATVVSIAVLGSIVALQGNERNGDGAVGLALVATIVLQLTTVVVAWAFAARRGGWKALGLRLPEGASTYTVLPLAVLGLSLLFGSVYVQAATWLGLDSLKPEAPAGLAGLEGPMRIVGVGLAVVIGPFAEELFWRGFVLAGLMARIGAVGAMGTSALLFALVHLSPGLLAPAFASGVLLAWLYLRTRSLVPGIIAHTIQNALALATIA